MRVIWGQWGGIHQSLTASLLVSRLMIMEVSFPNELQAKLTRLAAQQGRDSNSLVVEAVERLVDYDEWFLAEVEKGLAQIEQGRDLSDEEMGARLDKFLASKQPRA